MVTLNPGIFLFGILGSPLKNVFIFYNQKALVNANMHILSIPIHSSVQVQKVKYKINWNETFHHFTLSDERFHLKAFMRYSCSHQIL